MYTCCFEMNLVARESNCKDIFSFLKVEELPNKIILSAVHLVPRLLNKEKN